MKTRKNWNFSRNEKGICDNKVKRVYASREKADIFISFSLTESDSIKICSRMQKKIVENLEQEKI